ncbi:SMP-30/gluconolactonase/LRE family protein [Puia dinghuensis]|uniref:SMP-30/Gluconolactonase/LRE-like region domain-containing protein n=1 Tax=Puia dinghuensis TaxID=1792502 RepID=A0A8J2UJ34_9BACT|nr:hypothetical protein [Puia dinghuensis]GGB24274.1 hypothetical protein GCM10011511_55220 [Puia dinghuensis]
MLRYIFLAILTLVAGNSFNPVSGQKAYKAIVANATRELIPEGIAVDARSGRIYVGSMSQHKIVVIDSTGKSKDFAYVNDSLPGYTDISGLKIDAHSGLLWAVSTYIEGRSYTAQLNAFDLLTGVLKEQFTVKDGARHIFNDLILDPVRRRIYLTDTPFGAVYVVDPAMGSITILVKDSLTAYPNGIALSGDRWLYIATYSHGLLRFDLMTKKLAPLPGYQNSEMAFNLDGLAYKDHLLYGVYNSAAHKRDNALIQYRLNAEDTSIVSENIIDIGNPIFRKPTTLSLVGSRIYLLAVTNIDEFNANHNSISGIENQLMPVTILVYK